MNTALIWLDERKDYGEQRYCTLGLIGSRVYFLAFTPRHDALHMISFRKANKREVKRYAQQT